MQTLLQDLRYAIRQLSKSPGFTFAAVISLALGIGATTAVFSVIYAALINPYPYKAADRIVRLSIKSKTGGDQTVDINGPQIRALRQSSVVEDLIAMDGWSLPLTGGDFPEDVETIFVTSNGFDFLGEPLLLGRGILPSDAVDGQEPQPVLVLGYKFWQRHFNGNPDAVGQTLQLNRKSYKIVGIAAPRFTWYSGDVYLPLKVSQDPNLTHTVDLRIKPGVTREAAGAALQPLMEQFAHEMPKRFPKDFQVSLQGLNDWVVKGMGRTLYLLLGGVALLLAIGCGNVSILLLARGTAREHELAVRTAIGAGRGRIVRQLLTESLLLAITGAAMGVLLAYGAVAAMRTLLPPYSFAPEVAIEISLPVLFFSVGMALLTGILFGLSPAIQLSRPEPGKALQSGMRRIAGSVRSRRAHSILISSQIALTLLLLAGAGAAIEGFMRMIHAPLGYDPHNVISIWIPIPENTFTNWSSRSAYFEQLRERINQVPGVTATAFAPNATPPQAGSKMPFEILGLPGLSQRTALMNLTGPEFFSTLRIPLMQGRIWSKTEDHNGAHLVVINQAFARLYFPNGDAIGHSIKLPGLESRPPILISAPEIANSWLQIIGVVGDSRDDGLRNPVLPAIFMPWTLYLTPGTQILVRSKTPPLGLLREIRHALATVNPDQQAGRVVSDLDKWISDQQEWQQEHLVAWLFASFAVLALSLAAVGLYSAVSYSVEQRTNEFGIRMALGAQRGHVLRIVFA
ncbi:MAG TPA: ABC transporter permease, partial [Edaphobacter sp.]|nr:ABC transporter permease [Edaphobacter sp.]